ncbi:hypothetical protein AB1Y20_003313 [Prymnesium parvum]|uniref:Dolichol kinase n=1 Tax=Prymnesium parvum TaxID=97485 RepID=A0AB34JAH1_PRYPA
MARNGYALAAFSAFAAAAAAVWVRGAPRSPEDIMLAIVCWIVFLELSARSRPHCDATAFATRKLCHAGCGLGIMQLDPHQLAQRVFVWAIAASSILMTWGLSPVPRFRFARPDDVGVTAYLCLVSAWFYLRLPPAILAPVFFADPAGAVFGKAATALLGAANARWYSNKSVVGSAAVLAFTYITIGFPCSLLQRGAISTAAMVAEAVGGEYDNLALAAVVLLGWLCV